MKNLPPPPIRWPAVDRVTWKAYNLPPPGSYVTLHCLTGDDFSGVLHSYTPLGPIVGTHDFLVLHPWTCILNFAWTPAERLPDGPDP